MIQLIPRALKRGPYWGEFQYLVGGAITILKNISQWEGLSHILWNIKKLPGGNIHIYIYILVGGAITILKHMKVTGKDDIPYSFGKNKHVPKHQLDIWWCPRSWGYPQTFIFHFRLKYCKPSIYFGDSPMTMETPIFGHGGIIITIVVLVGGFNRPL